MVIVIVPTGGVVAGNSKRRDVSFQTAVSSALARFCIICAGSRRSEEKGSRCTMSASVVFEKRVVLLPPTSYVIAVRMAHVGQSENIGKVVAALLSLLSS